jgi:PAS domain S-box-containing protein
MGLESLEKALKMEKSARLEAERLLKASITNNKIDLLDKTNELALAHTELYFEKKGNQVGLRDLELINESALESSLAGFWDWDLLSNEEYLSPRFKDMFGYKEHEMENSPDSWQKIAFPEDLPQLFEAFDTHVKSKGDIPFTSTVRYYHKNGKTIWVRCTGKVVKWSEDGAPLRVIGCHVDITEIEQDKQKLSDDLVLANKKLAYQNKREQNIADELRQLIETANTPIFGIDSKGLVNKWNKTSEKITGFKKKDVLGQDLVQTYITKDYREAVKKVLDDALLGKDTANFEFPLFTKEGKRVIVLLNSSTRRNIEGEITGVLGVGQDITILNDYKENLESKVKERTHELEEALEREKELGKLKTSFVSTASHQFRTPLALIQSNAELLEMFASSVGKEELEKCKEVTGRIKGAIAKMTKLMNDVLVLGKLTTGDVNYAPQNIDLVDFCERLVKEFNLSTDRRTINVVITGEPYNVHLDPKLLTHSLSNLISNAFKFSFGKENPELAIHFKPKELVLSIKDYGIGIPKSETLNLFQPFFRANNVTEIKGTGLGLSIAKEYIEINKGQIEAKSILGEGSCFEIKFENREL